MEQFSQILDRPRDLSASERSALRKDVVEFFVEEYELEADALHDDVDLVADIGMDSLTFLELFDEINANHQLDLDLRAVAKYAQNHPAATLGAFLQQLFLLIEGKVDLSAVEAAENRT